MSLYKYRTHWNPSNIHAYHPLIQQSQINIKLWATQAHFNALQIHKYNVFVAKGQSRPKQASWGSPSSHSGIKVALGSFWKLLFLLLMYYTLGKCWHITLWRQQEQQQQATPTIVDNICCQQSTTKEQILNLSIRWHSQSFIGMSDDLILYQV